MNTTHAPMPRGMKQDYQAIEVWGGELYAKIPKSVFALAAWHLANLCSESADAEGMAVSRFKEEIEALATNGIISPSQAKTALSAIAKAEGK